MKINEIQQAIENGEDPYSWEDFFQEFDVNKDANREEKYIYVTITFGYIPNGKLYDVEIQITAQGSVNVGQRWLGEHTEEDEIDYPIFEKKLALIDLANNNQVLCIDGSDLFNPYETISTHDVDSYKDVASMYLFNEELDNINNQDGWSIELNYVLIRELNGYQDEYHEYEMRYIIIHEDSVYMELV